MVLPASHAMVCEGRVCENQEIANGQTSSAFREKCSTAMSSTEMNTDLRIWDTKAMYALWLEPQII